MEQGNKNSRHDGGCFYCGSLGPFSDEHAVCAGLGGDDRAWLLKECVCAVCNTDIFSKLETKFLRTSPVALARLFLQPWTRDKTSVPSVQPKTSYVAEPTTGILLEAEAVAEHRLAVVVGIGTNVVAAPEGTPTPATSLKALGVNISAEELFAALSDAWAEYRGIWDDGRGFAEIRLKWLECAAGLGQPVSIQSGGSTVAGTFDTIDESGCMIVGTSDGRRVPISAGDVYFDAAASAGAA